MKVNRVRQNVLPKQIISEQHIQQIGLSATANACDDLDLTVPHIVDYLL